MRKPLSEPHLKQYKLLHWLFIAQENLIGRPYCWRRHTFDHMTWGDQTDLKVCFCYLAFMALGGAMQASGEDKSQAALHSCVVWKDIVIRARVAWWLWEHCFLTGFKAFSTGENSCLELWIWLTILDWGGHVSEGKNLILIFCFMNIVSNCPLNTYFKPIY